MRPDPTSLASNDLPNLVLGDPVLSNPVVRFLQAQIGLEPESLGVRVIGDCLNDLARDFPGRSFAAIALSAQHDAAVFAQVVAHFSVNESWLFRNPEQFAELRRFAQTRARPLKVLSLPCACGEEPASIAITLQEAGLSPSEFSIIAGELDAKALAKARQGWFPLSAFRGANPDPHWFEQREQRYILVPNLFARIEYRQLNVLEPSLFAGLPQDELFDVIFCRNLLIYLHVEARVQVLQLLRRIAAPGALVLTGTAEPTLNFDAPVKTSGSANLLQPYANVALPNRVSEKPRFEQTMFEQTKFERTKDAPAWVAPVRVANEPMLTPKISVAPEPNARSLWKNRLATIEQSANDGDVHGACLRLEQLLDEAPTYAEAWYLRGVLASAQNDLVQAEMALDRASYLDPSHASTLRLRAEIARRAGDNDHAERLRARLKRREGGL